MWIGPEDHKIVGEHLGATRQAAGVTQTELAARLRKPQSFVSAYERGQRRIDVLEFLLIAVAMGANPQSLFTAIANRAVPVIKRTVRGGKISRL